MPSEQEKEADPDYWKCERCGKWFHRQFDRMREWASGGYWERLSDGTTKVYDRICNDCHRDLGHH